MRNLFTIFTLALCTVTGAGPVLAAGAAKPASHGTIVAFDIENLQITYDIADGVTNPANVRMTDADLNGTGACAPRACSPNQIRKVNLLLSGRSARPSRVLGQYFHNTLVTQISLRSLAFVDRYH